MIINSNKPLYLSAILGLFLVLLIAAPHMAHGQGVYFSKASVLKSFFADSERVSFETIVPDKRCQKAIYQRLGYKAKDRYTIYVGHTGGHVDGYAVIDNEMGQHRPITFATLIGRGGQAKRLEIMVYREGYGDEVRQRRFRKQFVGKTAQDPVRHGADIVAVSGATISSKAMATGVRRALVVVDELVLKSQGVHVAKN